MCPSKYGVGQLMELCEHIHRLKKQELACFAQSADEVVRAVEESVRKDLDASLQSSSEKAEGDNERAKLVIGIQDKDGLKHFRVYTVYIVSCSRYKLYGWYRKYVGNE